MSRSPARLSVSWSIAPVSHFLSVVTNTSLSFSILFSPDTQLFASSPPDSSLCLLPPSSTSPACRWRSRPVMWQTRQIQNPSTLGCLLATWIRRSWRSQMLRASSPSMAGCWAALCTKVTPLFSTPVSGMPGGLWLARTAGCWPDKLWVS